MSRTPTVFLAAALAGLSACGNPDAERLRQAVRPTYDKTSGRLAELAYDSNQDGRTDTWTDMEGARPLRSRIDADEDGTIDRWEYYDSDGRLVRVGMARATPGRVDAWALVDRDGEVHDVEVSSSGDERRIDRWEHYAPPPTGADASVLVGVDEDGNRDGRPDKWLTLRDGAIATAAFDEDRDGTPDRRLTYQGGALVLIESDPDASGRFTTETRVAPGKDRGRTAR
jgi:hypothetical protein